MTAFGAVLGLSSQALFLEVMRRRRTSIALPCSCRNGGRQPYFHMPDPDGHELSFARPI